MADPLNLGLLFTQQSSPAASVPVVGQTASPIGGIADVIARAATQAGQTASQRAQAGLARSQTADLDTARAARTTLGQLIANQFAISHGQEDAQLSGQGIGMVGGETAQGPLPGETTQIDPVYDPNTPTAAQRLDADRAIATERMTPQFIANAAGQSIQSDEPNGGTNLGNLLALVATGARDADSAAGFRGQPLSAGQSVFESGAHAENAFNQEQETERNDVDNATSRRNADVAAAANRYGSDQQLAGTREAHESQDRATRALLETSRAQRLDQQTLSAALNSALHFRRGAAVTLPPQVQAHLTARMGELMTQNPNVDASTAASLALDQLTNEEPAQTQNFLGIGNHNRRFTWTDEGQAYHPSLPAPPTAASSSGGASPAAAATPAPSPAAAPAAPPQGSRIDTATGIVYGPDGRVVGRRRSVS